MTGGLAGDGSRFKQTWVLVGGKPTPAWVVGVGLYGDAVGVSHGSRGGWDVFGPERVVTRSVGNVLYELDGEPALALYKTYLGERAAELPAAALLFPLSLRSSTDPTQSLVRTILAIDEANQSMTFAGDIPQDSVVQLMRANFDRLVDGASQASVAADRESSGDTLSVAISCVGRRLVLGERVEEEVEAAFEAVSPGEQARRLLLVRRDLAVRARPVRRPPQPDDDADQVLGDLSMHRVLERQMRRLGIGTELPTAEQWARFLERVDRTYTESDQDRYTLERALDLSSTEMRKRLLELRDAQGQLVLASRKAGMADVATNVLHNVGNVLNSVNVSASLVAQVVKTSARAGLGKSLALLAAQVSPGKFLDEDPRGRKVIPYLTAVDKALLDERDTLLREAESLAKHIEHIKSIVSEQLAAARGDSRGAKIVEQVSICELFDDAVGVVKATVTPEHTLAFVYDAEGIVIGTDRHKVLQILTNLVTNARDAIAARPGPGLVTLRARRMTEDRIALEVEDDGVGIAEETLTRMFSHGFTTKAEGHGFGLHGSACAATELGGSLTASSQGLGHGATFTLVLENVRNKMTRTRPSEAQPHATSHGGSSL